MREINVEALINKKKKASSSEFDPVASGAAILARGQNGPEKKSSSKRNKKVSKPDRKHSSATAKTAIAKPDTPAESATAKTAIAKPDTPAESATAKTAIAKPDTPAESAIAKTAIAKTDTPAESATDNLESISLKSPNYYREILKNLALRDLTLREMKVYIYLLSVSKRIGEPVEYSNQEIEIGTTIHRSHISKAMNGLAKHRLIKKDVGSNKNRFAILKV